MDTSQCENNNCISKRNIKKLRNEAAAARPDKIGPNNPATASRRAFASFDAYRFLQDNVGGD